jgi:hypothetical protein
VFSKTSFRQYLEERDYQKFSTNLEYHSTLNPKLWQKFELNDKVADRLEQIAQEFLQFLAIAPISVSDIIITGSNCSFNYSKLSDIDLHLIIDPKVACESCAGDFIEDCFQAKKNLWNLEHDISIRGYQVELYAQPKDGTMTANGIYSLRQRNWIKKPSTNIEHDYDDISVKAKAKEMMSQIDSVIDDKVSDKTVIQALKDKIKKTRQAGLEKGGEFSVENLAFKVVRNNGYMDKLYDYSLKADDAELSLK